MHCQEWGCARQKLVKTDAERCLGIDELGGGSRIEVDEEVTADKGGAGPPLPRIVVEGAPEVEPRRFYVLSADIGAHGHTGG